MSLLYRYGWLPCFLLAALTIFGQSHAESAPRIYQDKIEPHWFAGDNGQTNLFWYRLDLAGDRREFVLVNANAGTRSAAFDHARAAEALSKLVSRKIDGDRLPVEAIEFSTDQKSVLLFGLETGFAIICCYHPAPG